MVRFSRVCLAAVPMCHPQVIKSRQWMRHDGGNTLQYQDPYEGLRALPLKVMECEEIHEVPIQRRRLLDASEYRLFSRYIRELVGEVIALHKALSVTSLGVKEKTKYGIF